MSQEEQYLVSGAELECPCGTRTCKLKVEKKYATVKIGNKTFPPIRAAKKGENIDGFGMCMSKDCIGESTPCMVKMVLADKWMNPLLLRAVLILSDEEEAIHRNAKLLCISGRAFIRAVTTGQEELTESEKKFYRYMSEYFGFDDDVIAIMLKVIYAIDEEYPKESEREKAWRFSRLMGGFSYGFGGEEKFIEIRNEWETEKQPVNDKNIFEDTIKWNLTAGVYKDINKKVDKEDYFVNKLKLSKEEYYKLRFHVMAQHEITSRPAACYPPYITEGIKIEGSNTNRHIHPYNGVWKKFFMEAEYGEEVEYGKESESEKAELEKKFKEEWERLYKKYVDIPNEGYENLSNQYTLFSSYAGIGDATQNYSIAPNYADFSHQQILTAAITSDISSDVLVGATALDIGAVLQNPISMPLLPYLGIGAGIASNVYRPSLAGWLGDIRLADSKLSDDDYMADLDGLNISNLVINEDINTIEAINEYYSALESGASTREKEFLCNMGNGDASKGYENIKGLDDSFADTFRKHAGDATSEDFMERIAVGLE